MVFTLPEDLREQYRNFGLDLPSYNGDDSWTLPLPSHFVIDPTGTIRFVQVETDHTERVDPDDTIRPRSPTAE